MCRAPRTVRGRRPAAAGPHGDDDAARAEKQAYARRVAQIAAAETERTDEEAVAHLTMPV